MVHAALVGVVLALTSQRPEVLIPPSDSISVDIIGFERDLRPEPQERLNAAETAPEPPEPETVEEAETVPTDQPPPKQKRPDPPKKKRLTDLSDVGDGLDPTRDQNTQPTTPRNTTGAQLIASEADGIRRKLESCWREWSDIPNPESIAVVVRARFRPDGMLDGRPEIVTGLSMLPPGGFTRIAIERSINAFMDCQPFRMAAGRTTTVAQDFRFSPRAIAISSQTQR
jgi:hypothetical protein